jgi:hypothetical protein
MAVRYWVKKATRRTLAIEIDELVFALSPLFRPASMVRDREWPTPDELAGFLTPAFLDSCPYRPFAEVATEWLASRATSPLELYAIILGYSLRQLRYSDIQDSVDYAGRAVALARWAAGRLLGD